MINTFSLIDCHPTQGGNPLRLIMILTKPSEGYIMEKKNEVSQVMQNNQPVQLDDYRNLKAWQDGSLINTSAIDNLTIEQLNKVAKILEGVK